MNPVEIKRESTSGLSITWSDAKKCFLSSELLRTQCPCAVCRAARGDDSHDTPLTAKKKSALTVLKHTKTEELSLDEVMAVGTYAISILWGDGHHTGIYTYPFLRSLCEKSGESIDN